MAFRFGWGRGGGSPAPIEPVDPLGIPSWADECADLTEEGSSSSFSSSTSSSKAKRKKKKKKKKSRTKNKKGKDGKKGKKGNKGGWARMPVPMTPAQLRQSMGVELAASPYDFRPDLNAKVCLWEGDLTRLGADAIVNAANRSLMGGGGIDGAIHRAAGSSLRSECADLNGAATGETKRTGGHRLPAKYILHTVGPIGEQPAKLESCYASCLAFCLEEDTRTIGFCCVSTGIYSYPVPAATKIALETVRVWLETDDNADQVDRVVFCLFNEPNISIYRALMPYYFPPDDFDRIPAAVDSGVGEEAVADPVDPPEAADGGGAVEPELTEMDAAVPDGGDLGSA